MTSAGGESSSIDAQKMAEQIMATEQSRVMKD